MDNSRLTYHEMSFFLPLLQRAVDGQQQLLDPVLTAARGATWFDDGGALTVTYTGCVDDLIRELEESSEAERNIRKLFGKVRAWRRWGESIARLAAPDDRNVRLQAVGYDHISYPPQAPPTASSG